MKKKTVTLTVCVLCLFTALFSACGNMNNGKNAGEEVKNGVQNAVKGTENGVKNAAQNTENAVKNAGEKVSQFTSNADKNVDRTNFITEEMAKQIAVKKAGINANSVTFDKVEFDNDNGTYVYEVEFISGNTEYEADISAADGKILYWDVDKRD